jgi:multiple sugar transport system substrate-binding protein
VVVSEEIWGQVIRDAAPPGIRVNVVTVALPSLRQALAHAVAEGRAPDLAILDSVWIAEFAASGFLYALDGDEGKADDSLNNSQRINRNFLAGVVRIDVDVPRTHALAKLGHEPPQTWDELRAVIRALADSGWPAVRRTGRRSAADDDVLPDRVPGVERCRVLDGEGISIDAGDGRDARVPAEPVDDGLMPPRRRHEWTRPVRLLAEARPR